MDFLAIIENVTRKGKHELCEQFILFISYTCMFSRDEMLACLPQLKASVQEQMKVQGELQQMMEKLQQLQEQTEYLQLALTDKSHAIYTLPSR